MSAERSQDEYPGQLEASHVAARTTLEQAIQFLAPGASNKAISLELLNARASHYAVRAWRKGWRVPPDWVMDLLRAKLLAHTAPRLEVIGRLEQRPVRVDCGTIGTQVIRRWRAAQAAKKNSPSR